MFIRGGKLHYEMPDHSPAVGHVNCAGRKTNRNPDLADRPPGELAIHAGMQVNKAICRTEPYQSLLARHGYTADNLPTGKIIAVSRIADCCEVTPELAQQGWPGGNEYVFGNYAEGRYAWKLEKVVPLVHPISAKGRLGFWEYPVLEEEL